MMAAVIIILVLIAIFAFSMPGFRYFSNIILDFVIIAGIITLIIGACLYFSKQQTKNSQMASLYSNFKSNVATMNTKIQQENATKKASNSSSSTTKTTKKATGTVNCKSLNLRRQPTKSSNVIKSLSKGTVVEIIDKKSNPWIHVKLKDGTTGYVYSQYLNM